MKQKNLVLMVVAVGCGLVAAFLTSQMSGKSASVEKIEVIVAAKDLMIGSQLTKEDLKTALKRKTVAKDAVPPTVIETEEELLEKRFTRTIRAEEMIDKKDVTKGGLVSIPPGMSMVSLPISLPAAVAGFVGPGSRVDVLGSIQLETRTVALPVLVNMLVLAVDANITGPQGQAAYQALSTVSFAVDRKQALLIKLASARGCDMSLLLRNPEDKDTENDKNYDIDKVISLLADRTRGTKVEDDDPLKPNKPSKPEAAPSPAPKSEMVKVPAAAEDIPAGTQITNDLIAEKFKLIELPKDVAAEAITDLGQLAESQEVLKTGLGKGQWITKGLVGKALKPGPGRDVFEPKPGPNETVKPALTARKTHDVTMHTSSGTKTYRYEEVAPGEWKLYGEVRPNQPATQQSQSKPAEGATPEKTVD